MNTYPDEMNAKQMVSRSALGLDATPTMSERLHRQREHLELQLSQVNEAIDALESNPEVARAVDAISKVGGLY